MNKQLKKILPYLAVILGFIVLAYAYTPEVLQGKIVNQSDISSWRGMANEIINYNAENPQDQAMWTGSMFSGMPANAISMKYEGDITDGIYHFLQIGARPASYLLISLVGGFLLFLAFGVNIYLAALGAIAITFCSYNMQIIQVGHNTKMLAIAFMPWVLAGVVYAYRQNKLLKALLGALLFALALSFQIKANHPQITYYLAIIIFGFAIAEFCSAIKNKTLPKFIKVSALLLVLGIAGIATNANHLIPTYEYAKYTMRGGSVLSDKEGQQTDGGLDKDYATAWSYGIEETFNLMIPDFNGGASSGELSKDSETYKVLSSSYQGADQIIKNMPLYWGPQPFTAGPMYMGAISIFLFVLGLCLIKGAKKWWILGVSLVALFLSWGSHFMWFSELFFNYAPMYNKFRTVSMILVILQICIPVLGVLAINELLKQDYTDIKSRKKVNTAFIAALIYTAGLSLIFALIPSLQGDFVSAADGGLPAELRKTLMEDRMSLRSSDAFRSLIFILLGAATLYLAYMKKLKVKVALPVLILLVLVDLWAVDKRYLNESHFIRQNQFQSQFNERPVDKIIKGDKDLSYRVLDLSVNTFNDAHTSYHHKTIGGYSAAKLQRYQDLIDYHIAPEMSRLSSDLNSAMSSARTISDLEAVLKNYPVLSMLNTRYIVIDGNQAPLYYSFACGNAWFIEDIVLAQTPDEEIAMLGGIDTHVAAVLDKQIKDLSNSSSSEGEIIMTEYSPNKLVYKSHKQDAGIAVFSEIYYPAGWTATIDGQEVEILRANYALRALYVPAGEHEIIFTYSPKSIKTGKLISEISSILICFSIIGIIVYMSIQENRRRKKEAKKE